MAVCTLLFVALTDASAGNPGANVSPPSLQPRQVTSILPTAEQAAAYERGETPPDLSLFEFMVFGFDDEPLFKLEHPNIEVQQPEEPRFVVLQVLRPLIEAGVAFGVREMPCEEGIRYYLMSGGQRYSRNSAGGVFSQIFVKHVLRDRFYFVTMANMVPFAEQATLVPKSVFFEAKEAGLPYCFHISDTAYRRDYFGASSSKPSENGRILPQECPECGDDRTRFAAVAFAARPRDDVDVVETHLKQCLLVRTLMLTGIREVLAADPLSMLEQNGREITLAPEIRCVVSTLYAPTISEGMSRVEAVVAASQLSPAQCGDLE